MVDRHSDCCMCCEGWLRSGDSRNLQRQDPESPSLLRGLLFEESGDRFTPAHTVKRGKRYRYYISQRVIRDATTGQFKPGRIPARELEQPVLVELRRFFSSGTTL